MRRASIIILLCVLAGVSGCFPPELIVWSPDGRQAAAILADGLYLCDPNGELSPRLAEHVQCVTWLPDGRHLCYVQGTAAKRWEEIAAVLAGQAQEDLIAHAERLRRQVMAGEDWEAQVKALMDDGVLTANEVDAVKLYLRDRHWDELKPKLAAKWGKLNEPGVFSLMLAQIEGQALTQAVTLHASLVMIFPPRVSPDGRAVAFVEGDPFSSAEKVTRLFVAPVDGATPPRLVADRVALLPDWTPDGQALAYTRGEKWPADHDDFVLGTVFRRQVRGETGQLLAEFPAPQSCAGVVFCLWGRIRCLSDGRVVFSSAEFHLPSTGADMPRRMQLFAVSPGKQATVTRLIPRSAEEAVGERIDCFQFSPDEKRVAIPGDKGQVTVLTLATGHVVTVQSRQEPPGGHGIRLRAAPTWRSADELCLLVPGKGKAAKDGRPEFVLWSNGKTLTLSKDWPNELLKGVMPE